MLDVYATRGLDLVAPLSIGVYNAAVPEAYKIPLPETGLLVMVGNTKRLWEPFLASINLDCIPEHPLNEYAMRVVTKAVSTLDDVPDKVHKVRRDHHYYCSRCIGCTRPNRERWLRPSA